MKYCGFFLLFIFHFSLFTFYFSLPASSQPKYEFRAVWIATVNNIDWPSRKDLGSEQQKQEFISILDRQKQIGMNAVIVQVRPCADAFYVSQYEPWSEYLNGEQGKPSSPYYDPLSFMIEEAHKRGMEFHAWINPYRAVFNTKTSSLAPTHITRIHPEWFLTYGDKKYFNPGLPEVMQYLNRIARDIIERYDIDGLHMDDYFYPYRIPGKEFPDNTAYLKYGKGMAKDEWRRSNCDSIVKMLHETVLETKPYIKFGISPFGVWRNIANDPEGSNTKAGQTNYDDLYADILLWLRKDWIDYVAPQIYWEIGHPLADYETLVNWWSQHSYGKHIYIGHGIYKAVTNAPLAWRNANELPGQIKMLREDNNIQGSIFFSSKDILSNPNGWADSLRENYYSKPAIIPPMNWIDTSAPQKPSITKLLENKAENIWSFTCSYNGNISEDEVKAYVVYLSEDIANLFSHPLLIIPAAAAEQVISIHADQLPANWSSCYITVTSLSRENIESDPSAVVTLINEN